jgi:hypothetical protein
MMVPTNIRLRYPSRAAICGRLPAPLRQLRSSECPSEPRADLDSSTLARFWRHVRTPMYLPAAAHLLQVRGATSEWWPQ